MKVAEILSDLKSLDACVCALLSPQICFKRFMDVLIVLMTVVVAARSSAEARLGAQRL
jgi:hypothetical protein